MIKVENIETWGFEHAIRGMRNPLNSWDKSDTDVAFHALPNFKEDDPNREMYYKLNDIYDLNLKLGANDLDLMQRLYSAGPEHRKYLRQIFISMDITAPLYWWKEFDTYKIGTTSNSCSTMHKIHAKEFDFGDFSTEHLSDDNFLVLQIVINGLNSARNHYLENKDKFWWWQMIQMLPSSYNQKRMITMNYENAVSIIGQRSGHKLDEWREFVLYLLELPYVKEIMLKSKAEGSIPISWLREKQNTLNDIEMKHSNPDDILAEIASTEWSTIQGLIEEFTGDYGEDDEQGTEKTETEDSAVS